MRPDVMQAIAGAVHDKYPNLVVAPYLASGATDGLIYRTAGIPTFATSGLFSQPSTRYSHGRDERLPVRSFYEGLDHVYRLAVQLGESQPAQ